PGELRGDAAPPHRGQGGDQGLRRGGVVERKEPVMASTSPRAPAAAAGQRPASTPIADYGLLADCNSAALVDRAGSIDWLCLPRYDSPAVFSRLLDPAAGHWAITPVGDFEVDRRYVPGTLVIESTFTTETGVVRLTDALAFQP